MLYLAHDLVKLNIPNIPEAVGGAAVGYAGTTALTNFLERPAVVDFFTKATPQDIAQIPNDLRGDIPKLVKELRSRKGITVSPALKQPNSRRYRNCPSQAPVGYLCRWTLSYSLSPPNVSRLTNSAPGAWHGWTPTRSHSSPPCRALPYRSAQGSQPPPPIPLTHSRKHRHHSRPLSRPRSHWQRVFPRDALCQTRRHPHCGTALGFRPVATTSSHRTPRWLTVGVGVLLPCTRCRVARTHRAGGPLD